MKHVSKRKKKKKQKKSMRKREKRKKREKKALNKSVYSPRLVWSAPRSLVGDIAAALSMFGPPRWLWRMETDPWMATSLAFFLKAPQLLPSIPSKEGISWFLGCQEQSEPTTKGRMLPRVMYLFTFRLKAISRFPSLS